jgi:hypothetical protein
LAINFSIYAFWVNYLRHLWNYITLYSVFKEQIKIKDSDYSNLLSLASEIDSLTSDRRLHFINSVLEIYEYWWIPILSGMTSSLVKRDVLNMLNSYFTFHLSMVILGGGESRFYREWSPRLLSRMS